MNLADFSPAPAYWARSLGHRRCHQHVLLRQLQFIWRTDLSTGELTRIAEPQIDSPSLSWAADGRSLFVFGDRGLYLIDTVKQTAKRIGEGEFHGQADWLAAK